MNSFKRVLFFGLISLLWLVNPLLVVAETLSQRLSGQILLQVEEHGEAWYIKPEDGLRYYMKDGSVAYEMMRYFGLGITDLDLNLIPSVLGTTEMNNLTSVCSTNSLANRLKGNILLQVQQHGEAWYVHPPNGRRYYLGRPSDAFAIMRSSGLGITDANLNTISVATNSPATP